MDAATRVLLLIACAVGLYAWSAPAAAQAVDQCAITSDVDIAKRIDGRARIEATEAPRWLPDGQPFTMTVKRPYSASTVFYAIAFKLGVAEPTDTSVSPDAVVRVRFLTAAPDGTDTKVTFVAPAVDDDHATKQHYFPSLFWPDFTVLALACDPKQADPSYVVRMHTRLSTHLYAWIIAVLLVVLLYFGAAASVHFRRRGVFDVARGIAQTLSGRAAMAGGAGRPRGYSLNPLEIAAGVDGKASLSTLQLFFFSEIIVGLVAYVLLRAGVLSNLSADVLLLLGIAGAGTTAAQITNVSRQRLSFDNWAWLIHHGWLPENGRERRPARWSDLITTDGTFDAAKFQMLAFSVVVGGALLAIGLDGLNAFTIPPAILGILGLSQVLYIGGKIAKPASITELDTSMDQLRKAERDFIDKTASIWTQAGASDQVKLSQARTAAPSEYTAYQAKVKEVTVMFQSVIGDLQPGAVTEPMA
jgi:hypothetical protein